MLKFKLKRFKLFLREAFPEQIFLVWPLDVFVFPSETAVLGNTRKNSHETLGTLWPHD